MPPASLLSLVWLVSGRRGERQSKEVSKTTHEKEIAIIIAITAISIIAHPLTTPKPGAASLYWMMKERCAEHVRQSIPSIRVQNKTKQNNRGWRGALPARTERRC